jgi:protein-tyrosine phosphatase
MSGFVDIHSHILWDLDDGSRDFAMSLEMLRIAAENGTSDIVATPHADLRFSFQPDEIERKIFELNAAPGPKPRIHQGCDFHLHFDNIQDCLANPAKYTINHKRYLMVEFSDASIAGATTKVFDRMQLADITPVITHPERNALLMKRFDQLAQWITAGCLLQVTAQSFLGRFGKHAQSAAENLMSHGMVHFIASDAHDPERRPPELKTAHAHIAQRYGDEAATRLFITNPAATLTGDYLDVEMPERVVPSRKWYHFW